MPGPDGFPHNDPIDIKNKGPYKFKTYTEGLEEPTYSSSIVYYPDGAPEPFMGTCFTPGFTATKENYTFLGEMLASHGIVVLLTTPTTTGDLPPERGDDLVAAVAKLKGENKRTGGPLFGKLAEDRICVTGHSMGGGGTEFGATSLGTKIRCAMPLQPWQPGGSFPMIKVPIMFIGAQADTIAAVSSNAIPHYMSIPDTTEKFYVEFAGASHFLSTNDGGANFDDQAAWIIPFYKLFGESDERYRDYIYGDKKYMNPISRYDHSK